MQIILDRAWYHDIYVQESQTHEQIAKGMQILSETSGALG